MKFHIRTFFISLSLWFAGFLLCAAPLPYLKALKQYGVAKKDSPALVLRAADFSQAVNIRLLPDSTLQTGETGYAEYTFFVPDDSVYTISMRYKPLLGAGGKILRSILLNGELPFKEAQEIAFSRFWRDTDAEYKKIRGNQAFPSQVEVFDWHTKQCTDLLGYVAEPFLFFLKKGKNTLKIVSRSGEMVLDTITLSPSLASVLPSYTEYLQAARKNGASYIDCDPIKIQAEDAVLKSSPSFYPINDRTSPLSEPYHPSNIILNCIGGPAWKEPGEKIIWDVSVPKNGLYRFGFRFKQSYLRGIYASRLLRINDVVPFKEAEDLRFGYNVNFQFKYFGATLLNDAGEDQDYWFYLHEGKNRISLETALGELGPILYRLEDITVRLNNVYREIIAITGTAPDKFRDYQLFVRISTLRDTFDLLYKDGESIHTDLLALYGKVNSRTASVSRLLAIMDFFKGNDEQVVRRLTAFKESITAIGKSIMDLKSQPLKLDYFVAAGKSTAQIHPDGNFFQFALHTARAFIGSFFNDYNVISPAKTVKTKKIDVWLSTGRDQFEVIRRLINESFELQSGVQVSLKLINPDIILASTFSGIGPDLVIQITNTAPVNFAFRGAAYDLSLFDDFEQVAKSFAPAALTSFKYNGGCFALPDKMSFPVLYYRKDILDALNLQVPKTWDELLVMISQLQRSNMEIYLDTDPPGTLGASMVMGNSKPINTVFLSRLYQSDGDIYTADEKRCNLDGNDAYETFKWWTQFYTQHSFPVVVDFITRFRLGEVPIGVVDLSAYTVLGVSAPEIRGLWDIAPVPGTLKNGTDLRCDVPCVTGASMIIKNSVDARSNAAEAWEFLKWWTGSETQAKFAREMEAVLGHAGRYTVANLEAFETIPWPVETKETLRIMLKSLHGIPQIPGGYLTGRYLHNAFTTVITKYENPADVLFENNDLINEEIVAKRKEFGLE